MPSAKVAIELLATDKQARAVIRELSQYGVTELGKIARVAISDMQKAAKEIATIAAKAHGEAAKAAGKSGAGSPLEEAERKLRDTTRKAARERVAEHASATSAMAAAEKRYNELYQQYSSDRGKEDRKLTGQLIDDMKRMQDERSRILTAMKSDVSKSAKDELRTRDEQLKGELRMRKQIALDKDSVIKGGAGAKAGILGVGRELTGQIPGMEQLQQLASPAGAATAAALVLKKVVDIGAEFEDQMADMSSITGLTGDKLKGAGDDAREMGMKYGIAATEGVSAMKLVISALGPEVAQDREGLKAMTDTVLMFGKASGLDATQATDALTITLSQFGFASLDASGKAQKMSEISNIMAAAAKEGSAEIDDLSASMKVVGATANENNLTVAQTAAALEQLAPAGIKGAEAGTAFRNILMSMSAGSKEATAALGGMGLSFDKINPKKVGLTQAMANLNAGFEKLTDPVQKAAAMQKIFGKENSNAATILMKSAGGLDAFTQKITGTQAAQEMAETKMATFNESMKRVLSIVQDLALTLFEFLKPAIDVVATAITYGAQALGFILNIGIAFTSWIFGLLKALGEWVLKVTGLGSVFESVYKWIAGAIDWVKKFIANWDQFSAALVQKLQPAINSVKGFFVGLWDVLVDIGEFIGGVFVGIWEGLTAAFNWVVDGVGGMIKTFTTVASVIIDTAASFGKWVAGLLGMEGPIGSVVGWVKDLIGWAKDAANWISDLFGGSNYAQMAVDKAKREGALSPDGKPQGITGIAGTIVGGTREVGGVRGLGASIVGTGLAGSTSGSQTPAVVGETGAVVDPDKKKDKKKSPADVAKEAYQKRLEEIQQLLDDENFAIEQALQNGTYTELQAAQKRAEAQQAFNRLNLAAAQQHGQNVHKINQAIIAGDQALRKAAYDLAQEEREAAYTAELDALSLQYAQGKINDEDRKKQEAAALTKHNEDLLALLRTYGISAVDLEREIAKRRTQATIDAAAEEQRKKKEKEAEADANEQARIDLMEAGVDKDVAVENLRFLKQQRQWEGNAGMMEKLNAEHQQRLGEIQAKYAAERMRTAVQFMEQLYTVTLAADEKLRKEKGAEQTEENAEYRRERRKIMTEERDAVKRAQRLIELKKDHREKQQGIEDKYNKLEEEQGSKAGLRNFILQKTGLDKGLAHFVMVKTTEVLIHAWAESSKTATTEMNVFARIGLLAEELWATIEGAAASAWKAVTGAVEWIFTTFPFPLSLGVAGGAVASIYGLYEGARSLFGFAEGGIVDRPLFGPMIRGRGSVVGEAGPEAILPLSKLPSLLGLERRAGDNGTAALVNELRREVRGLREAYAAGPPAMILDQNKVELSRAAHYRRKTRTKW